MRPRKRSFGERALSIKPNRVSLSDLEREKTELEVKNQRRWYITAFAPYIAALIAVVGLLLTYVHERDAQREQRLIELSRTDVDRRAEAGQAERFAKQLAETHTQSENARIQEEQHHREEAFTKAVSELGSASVMERVAAVDAVGSFAHDPVFQERAAASLASFLEQDTDPFTEEALYRVFEGSNLSERAAAVKANLQAQISLARAYGRYVGIEMAHRFPNALDHFPDSKEENERAAYERQVIIGNPVSSAYYHRRPVEDVVSHDFIRDAFWLQNYPSTHQELFNAEKNGAWSSPPLDYAASRDEALDGVLQATRHLEFTSSVLEALLRKSSGNVSSWNLKGVFLVAPDFRNTDLHGIALNGAFLEMADLRNANFSRCSCAYVDLDGANFASANLDHTDLTGANLSFGQPFPVDNEQGHVYTYIAPGTTEDLRFKGASFRGANWRQASAISALLKQYLAKYF